ncbi:MAG TPA: hypothetical protein PLM59_04615 [Oscillospiraceae bacterium]|jgi:hypothetical protein|nr:hypothetical protein [Oscillospiraceae bacterium]HOV41053.1 hypothetical protein [Oscillospiraceae bacterium]
MVDFSAQQPNAAPQSPISDFYKKQSGTSSQQAPKFSCMPSEIGCIPGPAASMPQTGTWPPGAQPPATTYDVQYLNQFLSTQIGRQVTIEFLIGTNTFTDKSGTLLAVGTNYVLLQETNSDDIVACDFYNIKFVKIYY